MITKGTRVRLTQKLAKSVMLGHKSSIDLTKCKGTVVYRPHGAGAGVRWDGRKSVEYWDRRALEEVTT